MKRDFRVVAMAALCAALGLSAAPRAAETEEWDITLKYGKDMIAQWQAKTGQDGGAAWCFAPGRNEVTVYGTEPHRRSDLTWPCWEDQAGTPRAEVMALVTLRVEPTDGGRCAVKGTTKRWRHLRASQAADYRAEADEFSRTVAKGDPWDLTLGRGPDGKIYMLEVTVAPVGAVPRMADRDTGPSLPIEFQYEMRGPNLSGDSVFRLAQTATLQLGQDGDGGVLGQGKVSLDHPRRDLYFEVRLGNVQLLEPKDSINPRVEATFLMNRVLCLNPTDTGDTTMVTGERTIISTIERRITLKPLQRIHLTISAPEEKDMALNSTEAVELRPLRIGRAGE